MRLPGPCRLEGVFRLLQGDQRLFPIPLEGGGDQPVVGINLPITAFRKPRLIATVFQLLFPAAQSQPVAFGNLAGTVADLLLAKLA